MYSSCPPLCFCHLSCVASFKLATCPCHEVCFLQLGSRPRLAFPPSVSIPRLIKLGSWICGHLLLCLCIATGWQCFRAFLEIWFFLPNKQGYVSRQGKESLATVLGKWSVSDYGDEGQRSAYCLCTFRASSSPKADICHCSNKGASNPKAVWEVSLKRMTITLCPPCFNFSTDPLGPGSSIKITTKGKRGNPHGHSVFAGQDNNGLILLMALVTAGY